MRCSSCGAYTLRRDSCPRCGGTVSSPHPPSFPLSERRLSLLVRARAERRSSGRRAAQ